MVRPAFDQRFMREASQAERTVFDEHGQWLEDLYAEGRLRFAGRCYDGPFGLIVVDAENEQEARALMESDPSIRAGVQTAELYPFKTFIAAAREPG